METSKKIEVKKEEHKVKKSGKLLAVVQIRCLIRAHGEIRDAMSIIGIRRKHVCVVHEDTPSIRGMLKKLKDYIAYGEISEETYKLLKEKRGETREGKKKEFFRLQPPRGGFERKGIKKSYTDGGALGYRGEKMNDLIKRMI